MKNNRSTKDKLFYLGGLNVEESVGKFKLFNYILVHRQKL